MLEKPKPIGHQELLRRYGCMKQEVKRLKDMISRRNETIAKLRKQLALAKEENNAARS